MASLQDSQSHAFLGNISLKWNATFSKIMAMKLDYPEETVPCCKFRPSDGLIPSLLESS